MAVGAKNSKIALCTRKRLKNCTLRKKRLFSVSFMKKTFALAFDFNKAPYAAAAYIIAAASALTIAGAWFFQIVLRVIPCELCHYQRIPYYFVIPLAIVLAFFGHDPRRSTLARLWLLLLAAIFIYGAGVGVYHAGVEWGMWPGPTTCSGARSFKISGNLLSAINRTHIVPCDEVQWSFLGISLAGYNALIAGTLAVFALWSASRNPSNERYGSSSVSQ